MRLRAWLAVGVLLGSAAAWAQGPAYGLQTVYPSLPGKNNVRWWEFDWKYDDFVPLETGAPVRLYFYEEEKGIAEVAKPFIAAAYAEHAEQFDYLPTQRIPFLLYNSHFEFLSTRAFLISEGTLGVTSTEDLTMALPYWGEHQRFMHVMEHELAHQFTIQKVRDLSGPDCNPLLGMPLWFIEGLAELYSRNGLTSEVLASLADRIIDGKPDPLPRFFDDSVYSYERIYLLGHAQARFLEEEFGEGTVQRVLKESPRMCGQFSTFEALVANATGVSVEDLDARWHAWAKRKVDLSVQGEGPTQQVQVVKDLGAGDIDSLSVAPDGRTLVYRLIDRESGVARLYLRDLRDPKSKQMITQDQRIGLFSLHPTSRRVAAISNNLLVYIGRVSDTDRVFARTYERREEPDGRVRFELGPVVEHDLGRFEKLIEGGSPAISPTSQVAFSGLSRMTGFLDIYRIEEPLNPHTEVTQLTRDPYAETSLAYASDGDLYFISDETPDARTELFRLEGLRPFPVTDIAGDQTDVTDVSITQYGVAFTTNATGLDQAWRLDDVDATLLSNLPTSLRAPALATGGALLGVSLLDGHNELVMVPEAQWVGRTERVAPTLVAKGEGVGGAGFPAWDVPRAPIRDPEAYRPLSELNLQQLYGAVTGGPYIFGAAMFADRFKTNLIGVDVSYFRNLDRSSGSLTYINQTGRITWGGALFIISGLQLDFEDTLEPQSFIFQRIGVQALASYPLGPYTRIDGFVSPQAIRGVEFSSPGLAASRGLEHTAAAVEAGAQFALDTTKLAYFGPYSGLALTFGASSTLPFTAGALPFYTLTTELQGYQPLLSGYERLFLYGRIGAGANLGSGFREDFYVPATQNLRAYQTGSLLTVGEGYYLGQFELQFPLAPEFGGIALQGVVGADAGAVFSDYSRAWTSRVAAGVAGVQLALGPLALGFYFARPFDIGGVDRQVPKRWITHFEIATPYGGLPGF
ncbi:MAG: BamA/TamA family outer membrane protein [Myxococcaceae bacterium]